MAVTRLRTGTHPNTSRQLLDTARSRAGGVIPGPSTSSTAGGTVRKPTLPVTGPLQATGSRLIAASGGTQRDINAWRKIDKGRRQVIKQRVTARGGSLTSAVRKLGR